MKAIRKINPGAYRQPRWHLAADSGNAGSTLTICGKDVAEIKGDRRGSWQRGRIEHKDASDLSEYSICATCRNKSKGGSGSVKLSVADMKALLARAGDAGETAWRDAIPTPMIVYTPKDVLGSLTGGDDGGIDPNEPVEFVSEGICGNAWVNIKPGGSRFARWLIKEGYARGGAYRGGVTLSTWKLCGERGSQSYARWCAAADAIASVLRDAGITAYAEHWVD